MPLSAPSQQSARALRLARNNIKNDLGAVRRGHDIKDAAFLDQIIDDQIPDAALRLRGRRGLAYKSARRKRAVMRQRRTEAGERAEVLRHARRRDRALTDRLEKAHAPLTDRARRHHVFARMDDPGRLVFAALARIPALAKAEESADRLDYS